MKQPCLGIRWAQRAILFIGLHWDWVNHPPALSAFSVPFTLGPRPGATVSVEREQWKGLVSQNRSRRLDPPGELGLRCGQYPQSAFQCTKVDTQIEHMQSDLHLSHTTSPTTTDTGTRELLVFIPCLLSGTGWELHFHGRQAVLKPSSP